MVAQVMKLPNEVVRPSPNQNVAHKHKRQTTLRNYPAGRNENLRQYGVVSVSSFNHSVDSIDSAITFHHNQDLELDY